MFKASRQCVDVEVILKTDVILSVASCVGDESDPGCASSLSMRMMLWCCGIESVSLCLSLILQPHNKIIRSLSECVYLCV